MNAIVVALAPPRTSRVTANGLNCVTLRVPATALQELGWPVATVVNWRIVDGHLEGHPIVLQERT